MDNSKEKLLYKASEFGISKYANKKGEVKYQISANLNVLQKIIDGDTNTLNFVKNELEKL